MIKLILAASAGVAIGWTIGYQDGEEDVLAWVREGVRERATFALGPDGRLERRTLRRKAVRSIAERSEWSVPVIR